jgi:hypothetical protein
LPPTGKHWFGEAVFPAKSAVGARLLVAIPEKARDVPGEVALRQVWEHQEVGRLTWRLQAGVRKRDAERDPVGKRRSS